jgi:hypothetical protein
MSVNATGRGARGMTPDFDRLHFDNAEWFHRPLSQAEIEAHPDRDRIVATAQAAPELGFRLARGEGGDVIDRLVAKMMADGP